MEKERDEQMERERMTNEQLLFQDEPKKSKKKKKKTSKPSEASDKLDTLLSKLDNLEKKMASQEKKIASLTSENASLKTQVASQDKKIASLEKKIVSLEKKIESLTQRVFILEEENTELKLANNGLLVENLDTESIREDIKTMQTGNLVNNKMRDLVSKYGIEIDNVELLLDCKQFLEDYDLVNNAYLSQYLSLCKMVYQSRRVIAHRQAVKQIRMDSDFWAMFFKFDLL